MPLELFQSRLRLLMIGVIGRRHLDHFLEEPARFVRARLPQLVAAQIDLVRLAARFGDDRGRARVPWIDLEHHLRFVDAIFERAFAEDAHV